ncbi:MAG: FadR family transcriptional regulator [Desulfobacterales bacterium]|nr:FadR family transcriptional regulator [Desulfobacterales bacterium]
MMSDRIQQNTVVNQAMEKIKALIASGKYKTGDRLPTEQQLADTFGIGRTSIREAIKVFNHIGVLESKVAKGTFVCNRSKISSEALTWAIMLGDNEFFDLLEMRLVMEQQGFFYLVEGFNKKPSAVQPMIDRLEAEVSNMRRAIEDGSDSDRIDADYSFHGIIIEACNNTLFDELYLILKAFLYEEIRRTRTEARGIENVPKAHEELVGAIKSGDISLALKVLRNHIKDIKSLMDRSYQKLDSSHKNLQASEIPFS